VATVVITLATFATVPTLMAPPFTWAPHLHFTLRQLGHLGFGWRGICFYIIYTKFYDDSIAGL
jgi:hypothetical protein